MNISPYIETIEKSLYQMAKELPYFKFDCAEWISGEITLEDLSTQGLFINICAYYWFKSGCLTLTEIKRRVKCKPANIQSLIDSGLIKVDGENIKVSFLDEQFEERGHKSKINSLNGSMGGAPKGNKNAQKNNQSVESEQPKSTNIEENKKRIRTEEKEKREELPDFVEFKKWSDSIIDGNDFIFTQKFQNEFPSWGGGAEKFVEVVNDHFDMLNRYPKMNPNSQERFRNSVIKHFREYKSKPNGTGTKKGLDVNAELQLIANHIKGGQR